MRGVIQVLMVYQEPKEAQGALDTMVLRVNMVQLEL